MVTIPKIHHPGATRSCAGMLTVELIVAIAILTAVMIPLSYGIAVDQKLARNYYTRAVVMEILDGELEILAAGEWRTLPPGTHPYPTPAVATRNLPRGQFTVTVDEQKVRLEWAPEKPGPSWRMAREFQIKSDK